MPAIGVAIKAALPGSTCPVHKKYGTTMRWMMQELVVANLSTVVSNQDPCVVCSEGFRKPHGVSSAGAGPSGVCLLPHDTDEEFVIM